MALEENAQEGIPSTFRWTPWRSLSWFLLLISLLFESASGLYLYLAVDLGQAVMVVLYLHLGVGIAATAPCLAFILPHLRTAQIEEVLQSPLDRVLRNVSWIGLLVSLVTGVHLFLAGVWAWYWVWLLHVIASILAVVVLTLHVLYKQVVAQAGKVVHRGSRHVMRRAFGLTVLLFGAVFALAAGLSHGTRTVERPLDHDALGADSLFLPSRLNSTFVGLGTRRAFSNSRACGLSGCHEGIYQEWRESAHYWSANKYFLRCLQQMKADIGGSASVRTCTSCHYAAGTLTGEFGPVRDANADDATARTLADNDAGASCVFCHSIHEVRTAGGGANVVAAPAEFVFAGADARHPVLDYLYRQAVAMKPWLHAQCYKRPFYSEAKACAACHDRLQIDIWKQGPYYDASNPERRQQCQECHMPRRPLEKEVVTAARGKARSHRFLASNVAVAEAGGNGTHARLTREYLADGKIQMKLTAPGTAPPGSTVPLVVSLFNAAVGHWYPAGPEIDMVEAWLEVHALDEQGREIYSAGVPDGKHHLPRDTYTYSQVSFDTRLRPVPRLHGHKHTSWYWSFALVHAIDARTVDDVRYRIPLPADLPGNKVRVEVTLRQRKPCQAFMDWAFPGQEAPVVTIAREAIDVPIRAGARAVDGASLALPFEGVPRCDPYHLVQFNNRPFTVRDGSYQAMVDFERGQRDQAYAHVQALRDEFPWVFDPYLAQGHMLLGMGRLQEAEVAVRQARSLAPSDPRPYRLLGRILEARGDSRGAADLQEQAAAAEKAQAGNFFDTDRYNPKPIHPKENNELRRRINGGAYDADFLYVMVNKERLSRMPAGWGMMDENAPPDATQPGPLVPPDPVRPPASASPAP